jgi:hypothetical protein
MLSQNWRGARVSIDILKRVEEETMRIPALAVLALLSLATTEAQEYTIWTIAGGAPPPTPIVGIQASIGSTNGVAVNAAGDVYFTALDCVFKITGDGFMTRVAGTSRPGYSGDGGPATSAQLHDPRGVAVDTSGNLYIADNRNSRIRKVSTAGIITTVAGNGSFGYSGDGGPATRSVGSKAWQWTPAATSSSPTGATTASAK